MVRKHNNIDLPDFDCVDIMFNSSGQYSIHIDYGMSKVNSRKKWDRYVPIFVMVQLFSSGYKRIKTSGGGSGKGKFTTEYCSFEVGPYWVSIAHGKAASRVPHGIYHVFPENCKVDPDYAVLVFRLIAEHPPAITYPTKL
eukprot:875310_1